MPRARGPERACRNCGAKFNTSETGRTVNCPNCRGPRKKAEPAPREFVPSSVCTWCLGRRITSTQRADGTIHTGPCGMCGGTGQNVHQRGTG